MKRNSRGKFARFVEINCSEDQRPDQAPREYSKRWRRKHSDVCAHCNAQKKAAPLSQCLQCAFAEHEQLSSSTPDFVKVMFPSDKARPNQTRSFVKLTRSISLSDQADPRYSNWVHLCMGVAVKSREKLQN
jgi:hypothetical protein